MASLEKLNNAKEKKAVIKLNWLIDPIIVKPLQYLEEDYESYLVEVEEDNENYKKGTLIEIVEKDLEYVKEV